MNSNSVIGLALVATLGLSGCGPKPSDSNSADSEIRPAIEVTVADVELVSADTRQRELPGTVRAIARASVAAKVMGPITQVPAIGQLVAAGDVVVRIDVPEINAAAAQAKAALDLVTRQYQREASLLEQGASTAESVRNLRDQRAIAAAQLDAARAQQAHTQVIAPFAGRVSARYAEEGDLANPGQPLFALEGQALEVEVAVPESLPRPLIGTEVIVHIGGQRIPCSVRETSDSADPATRTRLTRLAVPVSVATHPGQFVRVSWPEPGESSLQVPASALTSLGQMQRVFVVADEHARLRLVRTGPTVENRTTILSGLNAGEVVVLDPPAALRDGQPLLVNQ